MGVFSELLKKINGPGQLENLKKAGYMSPQDGSFTGQGFSCARCDWVRAPFALQMGKETGFCSHPAINAHVELSGCSNKFTYEGVHTE